MTAPSGRRADPPVVEVSALDKAFPVGGHRRPALDGLDLVAEAGRFTSVIGPSGCGKSTLLRCIGGLLDPDGGEVRIGGRTPAEVRADGRIGLVPQSPALLPWRTAAENLRALDDLGRWPGRRIDDADTEAWLRRVGLADAAHLLPHQLSGGMQQRVALARAFALHPSLLLLDEPFSALDELTRATVRDVLAELWREFPATILFVTHSIDEAVLLSDEIVVMGGSPGRVVERLSVDLPRPRTIETVDRPEFRALASAVRAALGVRS